jgi:hypothetical protein
MTGARLIYPATARNRDPILDVLRDYLPETGHVLEIASGSGEHISYFARACRGLVFHPSDPDPRCRASIDAWTAEDPRLKNVMPPLAFDVSQPWPALDAAAVLCINMIHIAPWAATQALIAGARSLLEPLGLLYLYGPYKRGGIHTAPSNAAFDERLRAENPTWGVRDLEEVVALAADAGFEEPDIVPMPANNLSVIFQKPL